MREDLIIVKQEIGHDYEDITFNYKGYVIEEHYFREEDCTHHSAVVLLGGQVLTEFRWDGCLEKAMEYIDAREDTKKYGSEGLKALKRIRQETCPATYNPDFNKLECCDVIEKELITGEKNRKALELIIKKEVNIAILRNTNNCQQYNNGLLVYSTKTTAKKRFLNEEQYSLLKEVLL